MSFATVAELQDWMGFTVDASETTRAQLMLDSATSGIKAWTRQTIEQVTDDTVQLQGTWEHVLELPERPVTSVSSVAVDGEAQTVTTDYLVVRNELRRPNAEFQNWQPPTSDFFPFAKTGWGGPSVIVEVTYTHGFATIPDDIKGICLAKAARMFMNPEATSAKLIDGQQLTYGLRHLDLTDGEKEILNAYKKAARSVSTW